MAVFAVPLFIIYTAQVYDAIPHSICNHTTLDGVQCTGLIRPHDVNASASASACKAACCGRSAGAAVADACGAWQWADPNLKRQGEQNSPDDQPRRVMPYVKTAGMSA